VALKRVTFGRAQDEQGTTKFQWKNRISDAVDPNADFMVFPGDATLARANTGRAGDRVVILQFTSNVVRVVWCAAPLLSVYG
jgi:hypothetical protein